MKNKWGLILGVLLVFGFVFVACPNSTGPGSGGDGIVPVKFRFSGSAPLSQSLSVVSRNVGGISRAVTNDTASFQPYVNAYAGLGDKVRSITPTSMKLPVYVLTLINSKVAGVSAQGVIDDLNSASPKYFLMLLGGANGAPGEKPVVDFTKTATIELAEVESGRYDMVLFAFSTKNSDDLNSEMTFALPLSGSEKTNWINAQKTKANNQQGAVTDNGASVTMWPTLLEVYQAIPAATNTRRLDQIIFGGNVRKMASSYALDDFIPGASHVGETEPYNDRHFLYVPFENNVTIPDDANAVRFEISWDITGLIEQYKGADGSADTADDIFVLKNGWWDGFNIRTVIE